MDQSLPKKCVAEFIGPFALIFVGLGAIYSNPGLPGVAPAGLIYGRFLIKESR
jgi:hypothetical protein